MRSTLPLITTLALASASHAQCNVASQTTLLDAYRGMKVSVPNQPVPNGSAWSFWM
jgi:hypothetical protein